MRILVLAHQWVPVRCAGAETHLHAMCAALARAGHQVNVSLSRQDGPEPYETDGVMVWPHVDKRDPFRWLADADVLIGHLENTPRAMILGHLNNKPVVVVNHNTFAPSKDVLTMAYARVDLVVANSAHMADDLAAYFTAAGGSQPPTVICRPLVKVADYATTPGEHVTLVNTKIDVASDNGRLSKGGELLAALAARMTRTRFLAVTGAYGVQADYRGLDNVEVIDHVPHPAMTDQVFARTRILLMPSSYESWGRVAGEAMCSGIPVVAHPTPGLVEHLDQAGIFVDRDNIAGWVRVLRTLSRRREWEQASAKALARARQLEQGTDLTEFVTAVEQVAARSSYAYV